MDNEKKEIPEVMETYYETWQRVKMILLQKYASNGNTFLTMHSPFNLVSRVNNKERVVREKITYTEESHLERTSDDMRAVYGKLKSDIQKIDAEVNFNPQKYYISMHKNRNLAFFHFKRKKISIVVMATDKDARKVIKHHDVKALAASVQKFWNGSSCAVDIEDVKHLNEITLMMKKLVSE
jgi:predicted transport protein